MTWAKDEEKLKNRRFEGNDRFTLLITSAERCEEADCLIVTQEPREVFFQIVEHFWGVEEAVGISKTAIIPQTAIVGERTNIGHYTVLSTKTVIGKNCQIGDHVVIKGMVRIGDDCIIQSGVVIGENGMALLKEDEGKTVLPHYGGVTIGNRVMIGANTCICRGTVEDTILEDDAKVDKLCHIAHNCWLHKGVVMMAGTVLLSSVEVGENTAIYSALVKEQKDIGKDVTVSHGAVVVRKLPNGVSV